VRDGRAARAIPDSDSGAFRNTDASAQRYTNNCSYQYRNSDGHRDGDNGKTTGDFSRAWDKRPGVY
jgi:hypothetical protein